MREQKAKEIRVTESCFVYSHPKAHICYLKENACHGIANVETGELVMLELKVFQPLHDLYYIVLTFVE